MTVVFRKRCISNSCQKVINGFLGLPSMAISKFRWAFSAGRQDLSSGCDFEAALKRSCWPWDSCSPFKWMHWTELEAVNWFSLKWIQWIQSLALCFSIPCFEVRKDGQMKVVHAQGYARMRIRSIEEELESMAPGGTHQYHPTRWTKIQNIPVGCRKISVMKAH